MAFYNKKRQQGMTIIVEDNNINKAISQLKHVIAPVLKELKEKRYYEKPCDKRRRKNKEMQRNMHKHIRMLKQEMY